MKPTAIGSFIFAGGFTLGVEKHFEIAAHFEGSDYGVATFKANRPDVPVYFPIDQWPRKKYKGVDFVYCNPPCAPFSSLGKHSWETDGRVQCTRDAFSLLESQRPKVWATESVTQIFTRGRPLIDELTEKALALGYSVTYLLHDVKWFGMAQSRRRFFMIAHRVEILWDLPDFTKPILTVSQALKKVKPKFSAAELAKEDIYKDLWPYAEPGDSMIDAYNKMLKAKKLKPTFNKHGHAVGRPGFSAYVLRPDQPTGAIVGGYCLHWDRTRRLSFNECRHLNGFPEDYIWKTSESGKWGELARGVCPAAGEYLARNAAAAIAANVPTKKRVTLIDIQRDGHVEDWSGDFKNGKRITISLPTSEGNLKGGMGGNAPRYTPLAATGSPTRKLRDEAGQTRRENRLVSTGSAASASHKGPGRSPSPDDGRVIIIKVKDNPRRSDMARALFDLYKQAETLGDYKRLAKAMTPSWSAYHRENIISGAIELR